MSTVSATCPHCGASTPGGGSFCESCGKALPSSTATGPRIVSGGAATTAVAQSMVTDTLKQQMKKAFTALMIVAVLQTIAGPILLMAEKSRLEKEMGGPIEFEMWVYGLVFGIAAAFFILAFWARSSPLPAAIVGLVLFVSIHLLDAVADPSTIGKGIFMKIIIVVMLVQAIQAGLKYREAERSGAPGLR